MPYTISATVKKSAGVVFLLLISSLAYSGSFDGYWISDNSKTLDFNVTKSKLSKAEIDDLSKSLKDSHIYFATTVDMICKTMTWEKDNSKISWDFSYEVLLNESNLLVIRLTSKDPSARVKSGLMTMVFDTPDSFWVYDGIPPGTGEHRREYFKRLKEDEFQSYGISSCPSIVEQKNGAGDKSESFKSKGVETL